MPKFTTKAFLVYWLPVILWLGVIFVESMSPFAASDQTSRFIVPLLHWLMPGLDRSHLAEMHDLLRKVGHFTGYGLLSYFFFRAWRGTHQIHAGAISPQVNRPPKAISSFSEQWRMSWALLGLLCTAFVATLDELNQMRFSNRTGSWRDVVLDTFGGVIIQIAIYLFAKYRTRSRKNAVVRAEA